MLTSSRIETVNWLGTLGEAQYQNIDQVKILEASQDMKQTKWVRVRLGGSDMKLYCDRKACLQLSLLVDTIDQ